MNNGEAKTGDESDESGASTDNERVEDAMGGAAVEEDGEASYAEPGGALIEERRREGDDEETGYGEDQEGENEEADGEFADPAPP